MTVTVRRTRASDPEVDAELPPEIEIDTLHALLHQHGAADLGGLLLMRLTPDAARDLAALLARFRRTHTRPGLFRSYRRLLDADQARSLDLAVTFFLGAGEAGCRVYLDPRAMRTPVASHAAPHLVPLPVPIADDEGAVDRTPATPPDTVDELLGAPRIMPPWLPRPSGSSWDR